MKIFNAFGKLLGLGAEFLQDAWAFSFHNSYSPFEPAQRRLAHHIVITAHTVEKGLSLATPRSLFGKDKIRSLLGMMRRYRPEWPSFPMAMAVGALKKYCTVHEDQGVADPFLVEIHGELERLAGGLPPPTGGLKDVASVFGNVRSRNYGYAEFLQSRFSCRVYRDELVSPETVRRIVGIAQAAPSQCNRQSPRVHCFQSPATIAPLLELQGGSKGFSESVRNLFVVTSEITAWGGPGQRNQLYVDGALFAMNLLLACHAEGIAACPLNLAVENHRERQIKALGNIPARERVLMMVSFGYAVEAGLRAAGSPRLTVDEVLRFHDSVAVRSESPAQS